MNFPSTDATILVVDDNPTNLGVVCAHLTQCGFRLLTAENGNVAMRRLDRIKPDLILLDVMMPEIDGFELANAIRQREDYNGAPMIFMTALNDTENKLKGFESGGVDYITKPIQHTELLARVKTHLEIHRLREALHKENESKDELIKELEAYDMTVAHDLKNPLGIILNSAESFKTFHDLSPEEVEEIADLIYTGVHQCLSIVHSLLAFAQHRQSEAPLGPIDMQALTGEVLRDLKSYLEQNQARVNIEGHLPDAIGFAPWIKEVWSNLIINAVKYGGKPPVITIASHNTPANTNAYSVEDNGRGLPKNTNPLFMPFNKGQNNRREGSGLGLSIVERILRRLGGSIQAKNSKRGGAIFTFYLPKADT